MVAKNTYTIRNAETHEFQEIGQLIVESYTELEGFPKQSEQPEYYDLLANVGDLTKKPHVELLVAVSEQGSIVGAVVYFGEMRDYGPNGIATGEHETAGFRLLAVHRSARGNGIGKLLTQACIDKAKRQGLRQVIIHTTHSMRTAWGMYEALGFKRAEDLDFMQGALAVLGFRLVL